MSEHYDTGWRCLVAHSDGDQCIKCSCGKWVRPTQEAWLAHIPTPDAQPARLSGTSH
jgi:hypothetical protein